MWTVSIDDVSARIHGCPHAGLAGYRDSFRSLQVNTALAEMQFLRTQTAVVPLRKRSCSSRVTTGASFTRHSYSTVSRRRKALIHVWDSLLLVGTMETFLGAFGRKEEASSSNLMVLTVLSVLTLDLKLVPCRQTNANANANANSPPKKNQKSREGRVKVGDIHTLVPCSLPVSGAEQFNHTLHRSAETLYLSGQHDLISAYSLPCPALTTQLHPPPCYNFRIRSTWPWDFPFGPYLYPSRRSHAPRTTHHAPHAHVQLIRNYTKLLAVLIQPIRRLHVMSGIAVLGVAACH